MNVIALEIFDGVMLSDGYLSVGEYLAYTQKRWVLFALKQHGHEDWLWYLIQNLKPLGIKFSNIYPKLYKLNKPNGQLTDYWLISSSYSTFLALQHDRWYSGKRKIVPKNLILTPITIANWLMGDGTSSYRKGTNGLVIMKFATGDFTVEERAFLVSQLVEFGVGAYAPNDDIYITRSSSINKLINMVEPYLVSSFRYKLKQAPVFENERLEKADLENDRFFGSIREKLGMLRQVTDIEEE